MSKFFNFILWQKAYLDKGMSLTDYVKYAIVFLGLFDVIDAKAGALLIFCYVIFCWCLGFSWRYFKIWHIENDIQNSVNPFQLEVREKLSRRKL
jgi:hypothetical protein